MARYVITVDHVNFSIWEWQITKVHDEFEWPDTHFSYSGFTITHGTSISRWTARWSAKRAARHDARDRITLWHKFHAWWTRREHNIYDVGND